jgi:DNA helicase HerA-like ATPase
VATQAAAATSLDGRRFTLDVDVGTLDLTVGDYVVAGDRGLGQITDVRLDPAARNVARVDGRLLEAAATPFGGAPVRRASAEDVGSWLSRHRSARASLNVGALQFAADVPLSLDAGGFDRHTFLCGQSGSGKTYALGTILERLLVQTSLRIVILDPNSDFVRLHETRADVDAADGAAYANAAADVVVRRPAADGADRLHVRFRDFDANEQAAVFRLDPISDRDEYAALAEALETEAASLATASVRETVDGLYEQPEPFHSLGLRARNLGVDRWQIWSAGDEASIQDLVQPDGPRCVVADLGSFPTPDEQAVAAEAILAALWRRRTAREPILIVVDEAHNVCPAVPEDRLTAMATEHAVRIAGEGRKFGLVLLVATQRPQKVQENVISQCDNLVLMRMNSRSDLDLLAETFSFVPAPMLALSADFAQGEAVVAGKLVPSPTLGRFGPRWSAEGGADVPSDWALLRTPS